MWTCKSWRTDSKKYPKANEAQNIEKQITIEPRSASTLTQKGGKNVELKMKIMSEKNITLPSPKESRLEKKNQRKDRISK